MRAGRIVAAATILGALGGAVLGVSRFAGAQSQGGSQAPLPAPTTVNITTPDGGPLRVGVDDSVRLDVNASTGPGVFLAVAADNAGTRLGVDVANTPDVNVANIPTVALQNGTQVSLSSASLASIAASTAERVCTYAVGDPDTFTVGTTAADIPASPLADRTGITIWNAESNRVLWCNPAGTASDTAAVPIPPDYSAQKFEGLGGSTTVSCRCSSSTCTLAYLEEKCSQPSP